MRSLGLIGAVLLCAAACNRGGAKDADAARQARPVPVVAVPVLKKEVPIFLDGIGSVTAYKTVTVKTQVDGLLERVLFREGDPVKRGQLIAQIDPRPFIAALHSAEGALARDQAQLDNANLNLKRYQDLLAKKLIAEQQLTDQQAMVGQLAGTVVLDKAAIETAKLNITYANIVSPVDGVTGIRIVDPGNVVHAADTSGLVVITQLDPIAVIFTLPQDDLADIAEQMDKGELSVESWSREGTAKLGEGKLLLIDNQINATTGTLRLKAIFPNPQHTLWPNQFVKSRLLVTTQKDALVVPATVVQRGPDGNFAWVVGADSTVSARPVEVARTLGDTVLIAKGLSAGELVVTEGQTALRAGSKVTTRDASAKPDAQPAGAKRAQARGEKGAAPLEGAPMQRAQ